jgi:hypothetical protein
MTLPDIKTVRKIVQRHCRADKYPFTRMWTNKLTSLPADMRRLKIEGITNRQIAKVSVDLIQLGYEPFAIDTRRKMTYTLRMDLPFIA